MKRIVYFVLILFFLGCSKALEDKDMNHLNGYWEISKVTFPDGETKDFKVNPTVDYIEVKELQGFRKKVYPKFDGSYQTTDDTDYFIITKDEKGYHMQYSNIKSPTEIQRKESIIELTATRFSVLNKDTMEYTYKRFQPINATK